MRTTLIIQDQLLADAKKLAAERQSSVSEIVNEALRQALKRDPASKARPSFSMPTYRPPQATAPHDLSPAQLHELLVAEEIAPYRP